jgi:hypothetical protein
MCWNVAPKLIESTGIVHFEFGHAGCWVPYDQNNGPESFVEFCQDYQEHMINLACSAPTGAFRAYNFAILKGFNEYMMLNPDLFPHGYIGELDPALPSLVLLRESASSAAELRCRAERRGRLRAQRGGQERRDVLADRRQGMARLRAWLYVAATRARDLLVITGHGERSPFV